MYVIIQLIVWENTKAGHYMCDIEAQHMPDGLGIRLKAHLCIIELELYFPISHTNEHRLHVTKCFFITLWFRNYWTSAVFLNDYFYNAMIIFLNCLIFLD